MGTKLNILLRNHHESRCNAYYISTEEKNIEHLYSNHYWRRIEEITLEFCGNFQH